ncbi:MAG: PAC2 family protein [Actinobacteria bacterium]|nr:PAC2 family protein [Actinomycetota bacterium]MCB9411434.1 PAC2 family protein [Actinomycetota bacterium]
MDSPHRLVTIVGEVDADQPIMLHSLSGFLDAGSAGRLAVEHLLEVTEHTTIATFDVDVLYDYRARRPRMTFLTDHYGEVDLPELRVDRLEDAAGRPFLLLHGPEPDFKWQRFATDAVWLAKEFDISLALGMHAVPWPAPHTRPVNVTAHSNDPALIVDRRAFVGDLEVPAHMAGFLEMSLGVQDVPAMGFAAHVPHYLSASQYPRAAVALLEAISAQTGLLLPLDDLRDQAKSADDDISLQVSGEAENVEAIKLLEQQYDDFMARFEQAGESDDINELDPKEFVDQVERFLADRERYDKD